MQFFNRDRASSLYNYPIFGDEVNRIEMEYNYNHLNFSDRGMPLNEAYINRMTSHNFTEPPFGLETNYNSNNTGIYSTQFKKLLTEIKGPRNIQVNVIKTPVQSVVCDICNCTLNSNVQAEAHFKGQSHQKKLMKDKSTCDPDLPSCSVPEVQGVTTKDVTKKNMLTDESEVADLNEAVTASKDTANCSTTTTTTTTTNPSEVEKVKVPSKKKKFTLSVPCEICNLIFNSETQATQHFKSLKHLRKVASLQRIKKSDDLPQGGLLAPDPHGKHRYRCNICETYSNSSVQFSQHCLGQGHKRKMLNLSTPDNQVEGTKNGWFSCRTCDISCRTAIGLRGHVLSQEHKNRSHAAKN